MDRKILHAKRRHKDCTHFGKESNRLSLPVQRNDDDKRRSTSTSIPKAPVKNLAFNRLKRLRETLENERFEEGTSTPSKTASTSVQNRLKRAKFDSTPNTSTNYRSPSCSFTITSKTEATSPNFNNNHSLSSPFNCSINNNADEDVDMEWTPTEEVPVNIDLTNNLLEKQYQSIMQPAHSNRSLKDVYVVVDTNVFIDKLQTVINIMHITYADLTYPVIYVPWMVIQELDYFKDGYSVSEKHPISKKIQAMCRKAISYINDSLLSKKPNFRGQSIREATDCNIKSTNADDSILACCMQLVNQEKDIILMSSDKNLRNKAMLNNIKTYSPNDIINILVKLKKTRNNINIIHKVSTKLAQKLSVIIHTELKHFYGDMIFNQKKIQSLPWTFVQCINYMKEHFSSAFSKILQKQCLKVIDDFNEILNHDKYTNEERFIECCLSLLFYVKNGFTKHSQDINNLILEIKNIETDCL